MKATIYFTVGNKVGHIDVDLSGTALYTENDEAEAEEMVKLVEMLTKL